MRSDRIFYIAYPIAVIIAVVSMIEFDSPLGYSAQLIPHAVLLYYWFFHHGFTKHRLFSIAWIGFMLADFAAIIAGTFSAKSTYILALLGISFLSAAFFTWRSGYARRRGFLALFAVAYGLGYFIQFEENIQSELYIPLGIYAMLDAALFIVIAGMRLKNNFSYAICLFGLMLYMISDGLHAFHFFVDQVSFGEPMMGLLRFASLALFVIGIIEEDRTKVLI